MKAAVFHKPGDIRVDTVSYPVLEDAGDMIPDSKLPDNLKKQ